MPTTIVQAPVGAGKTEVALQRISQVINDPTHPFAKVWILLATRRQEVAFRQRLIELQDGRAVYFNAEFFNFYDLNTRILHQSRHLPKRIDRIARAGILRAILSDLAIKQRLNTFQNIAMSPGFLQIVGEFVDELTRNQVTPEAYIQAATTNKDRELAFIYDLYRSTLQKHDLVDIENEAWLALDAVRSDAPWLRQVDLCIVDGYDQFTPIQADLLAHLAQYVGETLITLTNPTTESGAGARNIGHRFSQAQATLKKAHEAIGGTIEVQQVALTTNMHRSPDLLNLAQNIFGDAPPVQTQGAIQLIEAPEPIHEVATVFRRIKRLLIAGTNPDDILIAIRNWGRYQEYCAYFARYYDLPMTLQYSAAIAQNPVIVIMMKVLALATDNPYANDAFRRRDVLDVLRSPYLDVPGFDTQSIDLLEKISLHLQVIGGKANWLYAIEQATEGFYDEEGEFYEAIVDAERGGQLSSDLETFFNKVIPQPEDDLVGYVEWLEGLIGSDPLHNPEAAGEEDNPGYQDAPYTFRIPECVRMLGEQPHVEYIVRRDIEALIRFKDVLSGMVTTDAFLRSALGGQQKTGQTWKAFYQNLQTAIRQARPTQSDPIRTGQILVVTAAEARGLPHDHVFLLGLSEGLFPAEIPEDPLHLASEIMALRERGIVIESPQERTDDEGMFFELISLARQSLTLSRPYIQNGKEWIESHLWRMVRSVFIDLEPERIRVGEAATLDEASTLEEMAIAISDVLREAKDNPMVDQSLHWLLHDEERGRYWNHIEHGRIAELARLSRKPHNTYSGHIEHSDNVEVIQQMLGARRVWSASQVNRYATCPYGFFANRLLNLDEFKEPETGLDHRQLGQVNHQILEYTYREIQSEGFLIVPEHTRVALEILNEVANHIFQNAPQELNFRPTPMWYEEQAVILRRLRTLVELDFSSDSPLNKFGSPRQIFAQELAFGMAGAPDVSIPIASGQLLSVRGSIDRVDKIGNKLYVVDYKSGSSTPSTKDMREGRNFQMMVYLLALDRMIVQNQWAEVVGGGAFFSIRAQEARGLLTLEGNVMEDLSIQDAQAYLAQHLEQARSGFFPAQPAKTVNGKCASYCEYSQLCRLAVTNQFKE